MLGLARSAHSPRRSTATILSAAAAALVLMVSASQLQAQRPGANLAGTPDDGVVCRTDYVGAVDGAAFKCSKNGAISINLSCGQGTFPKYTARDGGDICTRQNLTVGATEPLTGLTLGTDYVRADVRSASVDSAVAAAEAAEVSALGLTDADVDASAQAPTIDVDPVGVKDKAKIRIRFFTFAVARGSALSMRP
ncbi:MAG: hypothetical protein ACKVZ0_16010 [Gemmatimonadales bacterium]